MPTHHLSCYTSKSTWALTIKHYRNRLYIKQNRSHLTRTYLANSSWLSSQILKIWYQLIKQVKKAFHLHVSSWNHIILTISSDLYSFNSWMKLLMTLLKHWMLTYGFIRMCCLCRSSLGCWTCFHASVRILRSLVWNCIWSLWLMILRKSLFLSFRICKAD